MNTPLPVVKITASHRLIRQILAYTDAHPDQKVTLRELADHLGVSVSTVTQTFQKEMGISFHRYLTQQRIDSAAERIRAGMPLEEAGAAAGYTDHSSFYRAFRQIHGISPREYRRRLLQKEDV